MSRRCKTINYRLKNSGTAQALWFYLPDGWRFVDLVSRKALVAGTVPLPAANVLQLTTSGRKTIESITPLAPFRYISQLLFSDA